jgi:hypothetical protein
VTPEAQRIAIAGACGWRKDKRGLGWLNPSGEYSEPPDYLNDLNAMHEAEKRMPASCWTRYCQHLARLGKGSVRFVSVHSTAAQRAEAFLRTLNLWTDEQ